MPPGGDPAFLIFWFFLIKQKERTKETYLMKISLFNLNDKKFVPIKEAFQEKSERLLL